MNSPVLIAPAGSPAHLLSSVSNTGDREHTQSFSNEQATQEAVPDTMSAIEPSVSPPAQEAAPEPAQEQGLPQLEDGPAGHTSQEPSQTVASIQQEVAPALQPEELPTTPASDYEGATVSRTEDTTLADQALLLLITETSTPPFVDPPPPAVTVEHQAAAVTDDSTDAEAAPEPPAEATEPDVPQWVLFEDDESEPTEEELEVVKDTEATNDATNVAAHEKIIFTDVDDPDQRPSKKIRMSWIIKGLRGTKEDPNRAEVMHSPAAYIDGLYWQIKFFPRGNKCSSVSGYIQCSKLKPTIDKEQRQGHFCHFESRPDGDISFDAVPKKYIKIKPRSKTHTPTPSVKAESAQLLWSPQTNDKPVPQRYVELVDVDEPQPGKEGDFRVSAQLGMVIYNPSEPRTATCQSSEHLFCPSNNDWGWSNLAGKWDEIHTRQTGQRQALLKNDTIAIDAYIRIFDDSAQSLFWHNSTDEPDWPSKALAGCLPMGTPPLYYSPGVAGTTALLFLKPFRDVLQQVNCEGWRSNSRIRPRPFIARLQCVLHQMRHGTTSFVDVYPVLEALREVGEVYTDVVTFWEMLRRAIELELEGEEGLLRQLSAIFDVSGQPYPLITLPVRSAGDVQDALNKADFSTHTSNRLDNGPEFLPLLLQREEFNTMTREWKIQYDKMKLNETIRLPFGTEETYVLYGFVVHVGARNSGRFYSILRPQGPGSKWLAFEDSDGNKIYSYTRKSLETYEGLEGTELKDFASTRETCYLAMYIRADRLGSYLPAPLESYTVPEWLSPIVSVMDGEEKKKQTNPWAKDEHTDVEVYLEGSIIGRRGLLDMYNVKQPTDSESAWQWSLPTKTTFQDVRKQIAERMKLDDPIKLNLFVLGYGEVGEFENARWQQVKLKRPLKSWKGTTRPICIWVSVLQTKEEVDRFGEPDSLPEKRNRPARKGAEADLSAAQGEENGAAADTTVATTQTSESTDPQLETMELARAQTPEMDLSASGLLQVHLGSLDSYHNTDMLDVEAGANYLDTLFQESPTPDAASPDDQMLVPGAVEAEADVEAAPPADIPAEAPLEQSSEQSGEIQHSRDAHAVVQDVEPAVEVQQAIAPEIIVAGDVDEMSLAVTHGHLIDTIPQVNDIVAAAVEAQNMASQQYATSAEDEAAIAALIAADAAGLSGATSNSESTAGETPEAVSDEAGPDPSTAAAGTASVPDAEHRPKKRRSFVYGFIQKFDVDEQDFIVLQTFFAYRNESVRESIRRCLKLKVDENFHLWYRTSAIDGVSIKQDDTFNDIDFVHGADVIFGTSLSEQRSSAVRAAGNFCKPFELLRFLQLRARKSPQIVTVGKISFSDFGQERYEGPLVNGQRHGVACDLTYSNGQNYHGPLVCGVREGPNGLMTYASGDTYLGEWKNNEQDGQGVLIQKRTGNKYEGSFQNGKKWGKGVTTWQVADNEADMCQICYGEEINALFFDCGHVCSCVDCAKQCDVCPICRKAVRQVVKMFRV